MAWDSVGNVVGSTNVAWDSVGEHQCDVGLLDAATRQYEYLEQHPVNLALRAARMRRDHIPVLDLPPNQPPVDDRTTDRPSEGGS